MMDSAVLPIVEQRLAESAGDSRRLLHGRGRLFKGYEQLSIDCYHPVIVITQFADLPDADIAALAEELWVIGQPHGIQAVALQKRQLRDAPVQCLCGQMPPKLVARENGLEFAVQLGGRQNLGFFLDMAVARGWLAERAGGRSVLNLFAYTCAFSVVASAAGAAQVVNLDMSAAALRQGQQNHQRNGLRSGARFLSQDLFRSWSRLRKTAPYDIVIVDPPSRQPGSFVAEADYARVIRKLPALCNEGADLLLCLNSPHLETAFLLELVASTAPELKLQKRLPNPVEFADINEELSLKVFHYSLLSK